MFKVLEEAHCVVKSDWFCENLRKISGRANFMMPSERKVLKGFKVIYFIVTFRYL